MGPGATAFCLESNREGINILVVKGTTNTGMKDVGIKATVITLANFGVGQLTISADEQFDGSAVLCQAVSLQIESSHLGGIVG